MITATASSAINGGIVSLEAVAGHLEHVDGVMIGRAAYDDPYVLAAVDQQLFGAREPVPTREVVALTMIPYIERCLQHGVVLSRITRHMLGLFTGIRGARAWRRILTVESCHKGAGLEVLLKALETVQFVQSELDS